MIPDVTDSTWAKIRFGPDGWQRVASVLGSITDEPALVVIHNAVRDAVRDAQLAPAEALDLLGTGLPPTRSEVIMTQLLSFAANQLAGPYSPVGERPARLARVHNLATVIMAGSKPASDQQLDAFRACVHTSVDDQLLRSWYDETHLPDGLNLDPELRWMRRTPDRAAHRRRCADRNGTRPGSERLGRNHAAQARASIPLPEAKEAAWQLLMQPSDLSAYELYATADGFFDPRQTDLTAAYVPRYFAEIGATADFRSGWVLGGVATKAFPSSAATPETVQLAEADLEPRSPGPGAPGPRRRHRPAAPRRRLAVPLQLIRVDRSDHRSTPDRGRGAGSARSRRTRPGRRSAAARPGRRRRRGRRRGSRGRPRTARRRRSRAGSARESAVVKVSLVALSLTSSMP